MVEDGRAGEGEPCQKNAVAARPVASRLEPPPFLRCFFRSILSRLLPTVCHIPLCGHQDYASPVSLAIYPRGGTAEHLRRCPSPAERYLVFAASESIFSHIDTPLWRLTIMGALQGTQILCINNMLYSMVSALKPVASQLLDTE